MSELAHQWVERKFKLTLNDFQRRAVDLICRSQGCGPYDLRCWETADWQFGYGVRFVLYRPRLSSFDGIGLTTLVIGAHEEMIRVEIDPVNFTHLAISMHQRHSRQGAMHHRHPTIEQSVLAYRERVKCGSE